MTDIKMIIGSIKNEDGMEACKLPVKYNHGKYADQSQSRPAERTDGYR